MTRKASNQVRIIGGLWRSRVIRFSDASGLRPTPERVRETLFNWLGQSLDGKTCLDLFAGSGALSFEALSRGAEAVTMIEQSSDAIRSLRENANILGASNASIVQADGLQFLRSAAKKFDIVFLDPPFNRGMLEQALTMLGPWLTPTGTIYAESELTFAPSSEWKILKQSRAGQVKFQIMTLASLEET